MPTSCHWTCYSRIKRPLLVCACLLCVNVGCQSTRMAKLPGMGWMASDDQPPVLDSEQGTTAYPPPSAAATPAALGEANSAAPSETGNLRKWAFPKARWIFKRWRAGGDRGRSSSKPPKRVNSGLWWLADAELIKHFSQAVFRTMSSIRLRAARCGSFHKAAASHNGHSFNAGSIWRHLPDRHVVHLSLEY